MQLYIDSYILHGEECFYLVTKMKRNYFSVISRDILYEESAPLITHEELNKVRTSVSLQQTLVLVLCSGLSTGIEMLSRAVEPA